LDLALNVAAGITSIFVRLHAGAYFSLTGVLARQQELAADSFSASLVGAEVAARALRRSALDTVAFDVYMQSEVSAAVGVGGMPSDLLLGYDPFRRLLLASPMGEEIRRAVMESPPRFGDSHPTLRQRLAALGEPTEGADETTLPRAITLFSSAGHRCALLRLAGNPAQSAALAVDGNSSYFETRERASSTAATADVGRRPVGEEPSRDREAASERSHHGCCSAQRLRLDGTMRVDMRYRAVRQETVPSLKGLLDGNNRPKEANRSISQLRETQHLLPQRLEYVCAHVRSNDQEL
jgi:hypothetical protein